MCLISLNFLLLSIIFNSTFLHYIVMSYTPERESRSTETKSICVTVFEANVAFPAHTEFTRSAVYTEFCRRNHSHT
jgi:hypothetical protein